MPVVRVRFAKDPTVRGSHRLTRRPRVSGREVKLWRCGTEVFDSLQGEGFWTGTMTFVVGRNVTPQRPVWSACDGATLPRVRMQPRAGMAVGDILARVGLAQAVRHRR